MTKVAYILVQLEEQLREDGYKGTQKAMRLLKSLRSSLEETGDYSFEIKDAPKKPRKAKAAATVPAKTNNVSPKNQSIGDALDSLV